MNKTNEMCALLCALALVACSSADPIPIEHVNAGSKLAEPEAALPDAAPLEDAAPAESAADDSPYVIEVREESYETFVDIHPVGAEKPAFDYRPKSKTLRIGWDKSRPRSEQVADLSKMLVQLHEKYKDGEPPTRLMISLDYLSYPEYVERLARHASGDPVWLKPKKAKKGTVEPHIKRLHGYIEGTTTNQKFHPDLDEIFAALGLRVVLDDVEKCSVVRPGAKGEMGQWLASVKIPGKKAVPVGCLMAVFRIEKP